MIITHKIAWDKCLSHQLWPAIEKGWKDEDKNVHFFWGLAGKNIPEIAECERKGEEWWYVDVGYITEQITRYPEPVIHNYDKTYFRIIKGNIHTRKFHAVSPDRWNILDKQGIDTFGGWDETPDGRQHVSFEAFVLPLINSVKELTEKNERLENKIKDLEIFIIDKLGEK